MRHRQAERTPLADELVAAIRALRQRGIQPAGPRLRGSS
jgi:hypothetical protein